MVKVIVTDCDIRTGLVVSRSLAKKGVKVISVSRNKSMAYFSKYPYKKITFNKFSEEEYLNYLVSLYEIEGKPYIFPILQHTAILLFSKFPEQEYDRIIAPPPDILELVTDKSKMVDIAKKNKVPIPESYYLNIDYVENIVTIVKNILIKLKRKQVFIKVASEIGIPPGPNNRYIFIDLNNLTLDEAVGRISNFVKKKRRVLIQEYIKGVGIGIAGVFKDGKPVAVGGHQRILEHYTDGGPSVICISKINRQAYIYSLRLMRDLNYTGIAMIEFKKTQNDELYFMEINPRVWGSIPLYIYCGLDIPYIAYSIHSGNKNLTNMKFHFKEGFRVKFLYELLTTRKTNKISYKDLFQTFLIPGKDGIFEFTDPFPFIMQFVPPILNRLKRIKV